MSLIHCLQEGWEKPQMGAVFSSGQDNTPRFSYLCISDGDYSPYIQGASTKTLLP